MKFFILLVILLISTKSFSDYGDYEVSGSIRTDTCEKYTKETKEKGEFTIYTFWFFGYMGAFNQLMFAKGLLDDTVSTVRPKEGGYEMMDWVNKFCKDHPKTPFIKAGKEAGVFFLNQKIKNNLHLQKLRDEFLEKQNIVKEKLE